MDHKQELLHKYLRKQCSQEELLLLFTYLKEDSEAEYQTVMDAIWEELTSDKPLPVATSKNMYTTIRTRMESHPARPKSIPLYHRVLAWPSLRIAAAFAVLLLSIFVFYQFAEDNDRIVYQTDYGQTTTVELPDHSVVTLNGNTRIHYSKNWSDSLDRELWIEGEAYFSIQHTQNDQKFIVHANQLDIEVLGTEFNVNNRDGDTRVTLSSGKIKLNDTEGSPEVRDVIMRPGEQAELTRSNEFELKVVKSELYTSWKDKELIFDHTPMAEVVRMIETTYGLEVTIRHQEINNMELTGLLPSDDMDMLLNMLSEIFDLKVTRKGNRVLIDQP